MALMPQGKAFDSSKHEDMDSFEPLPKGTYPAQVVKSEIKPTKAGTGTRLVLHIQVINGEFKGKTIFSGLNLENPNQQAVEISQKELATLCRAVNVLNLQDSEQLHNIPFMVSVTVKPAKGDYPPSNQITGYAPYSEKLAGQATEPSKPQTKKASGSTPPWLKKDEAPSEEIEKFDDDDIPV
jgi:hypothetical protein